MKARDIIEYVFQIAPNPDWAKENIYEFGGPETEVRAVGVAWWIDSKMLEDFARKGITLGLTHERVIYDLPQTYAWGTPCRSGELGANQRIARLCGENGITIHRFHSNLDLADWGMPHALLEQLGWSSHPVDWSRGIPVVTHPPVRLADLIGEVKAGLRLHENPMPWAVG